MLEAIGVPLSSDGGTDRHSTKATPLTKSYPNYDSVRRVLDSVIMQLWGFLTACGGIEAAVRVGGYRDAVNDLWWTVARDRAIDREALRDRLRTLVDLCPPEVAHLRERLTHLLDELAETGHGARRA